MTTLTTMPVEGELAVEVPQGFWTRARKIGAGLVLAGVVAAVVFGALATSRQARFTLSEDAGGAALEINGTVGAILFGLVCAAVGAGLLAGAGRRWFGWLLGVGVVAFVLSFLCWQ
ncbi:MAG TPA: ABC transporter permease, partial [Micromonosporaceae bacterium]|nr:ABC transporter permease [Micromonosporaceae bacterium]